MKGINMNFLSKGAVESLGFTKGEIFGMLVAPAALSAGVSGAIGIANIIININNAKKQREQQAEALEWQKQQAIMTHDNIANYAQITTDQALCAMYEMAKELRNGGDDGSIEEVYTSEDGDSESN